MIACCARRCIDTLKGNQWSGFGLYIMSHATVGTTPRRSVKLLQSRALQNIVQFTFLISWDLELFCAKYEHQQR